MSSQRDESNKNGEWDAYSDYQHISRRVAARISDATDAIQKISGAKKAGEKIKPPDVTDLRADVMAAVIRLQAELENERDTNETYDEILTRWHGEDGFIAKFENMSVIAERREPWLNEFAADLNRAGWELGYLKAGDEKQPTRGGDADDGEPKDLIEGMSK